MVTIAHNCEQKTIESLKGVINLTIICPKCTLPQTADCMYALMIGGFNVLPNMPECVYLKYIPMGNIDAWSAPPKCKMIECSLAAFKKLANSNEFTWKPKSKLSLDSCSEAIMKALNGSVIIEGQRKPTSELDYMGNSALYANTNIVDSIKSFHTEPNTFTIIDPSDFGLKPLKIYDIIMNALHGIGMLSHVTMIHSEGMVKYQKCIKKVIFPAGALIAPYDTRGVLYINDLAMYKAKFKTKFTVTGRLITMESDSTIVDLMLELALLRIKHEFHHA